ncbi:MAG: DNA translocase FtsK [Victivallaceae bacterium]
MASINNKKADVPEPWEFKLRYSLYIAVALLIVLAIFSHSPADYSVIQGGSDAIFENWIGSVGAYLSCFMLYLFGIASYPIILLLVICALRPLLHYPTARRGYLGALSAVIIGITILFAISPDTFVKQTEALGLGRSGVPGSALSGGVIGQVMAAPKTETLPPGYVRRFIGTIGAVTVALVFLLSGLVFIWLADWQIVFKNALARAGTEPLTEAKEKLLKKVLDKEAETAEKIDNAAAKNALLELRNKPAEVEKKDTQLPLPVPEPVEEPVAAPPVVIKENTRSAVNNVPQINTTVQGTPASAPKRHGEYVLPPITMLSKGPEASGESISAIERSKLILQQTLESFNVDGQVTDFVSGPRVTRYEISLAPGVKVEKVTSIANNIKMELEAESIRILAPVPGRNAVGVEAPNSKSEAVFMRSLMESEVWSKNTGEIPIVLGKDVAGKVIILDLAKAPHLLIAGSTGSGKSVCMNTLIMSLLFQFSPDELRLIMVDPKVVELEVYKTLPHLITPVVNDPQKVPLALRWAVNEMEKRYRILAKARVKHLKGYNTRPASPEPVFDDNGDQIPERLPVLVVIVDELADMMMTDAKADIETSIARIAQKGRAAGIHIVIATQRPSTNIITGVIKANLPTRIAFRVGSIVDSRVILDQKGAESLLGRGDMLLMPPGSSNLERIQGAIIEDADIEKVVEFVSAQAEQDFNKQVVAEEHESNDDDTDNEDSDEVSIDDAADISPVVQKYLQPDDNDLIRKALEIVLLEQKASTSYLQRRLKIGYNRAAELMDMFEERGIVGPPPAGGSKRDILVFDSIGKG